MIQGKTWEEITQKLKLTQARTMQIWDNALKKIADAPNELKAKDQIIEKLQNQLHDKQVKKEQDDDISPQNAPQNTIGWIHSH